ncbi:MAG: response regulator [Betaproteobacteria bacterium]|nr:response regulator [Betaproteobacteria bacterium]
MTQNPIYSQTDQGRAELTADPGKLARSLRVLLGMVDGRSTVDELQRKLGNVDPEKLRAALQSLAAHGYVALAKAAEPAGEIDFASFMGQPIQTPTAEQKRDAEQKTLSGMRSLKSSGYFVNIVSRPAGRVRPRAGEQYSVLILDGDQANALAVARALMLAKFEVRSASRPDQIMAELNKPAPDLILMDVMLPELVGLDVLAKLREHPNFKTVPVLIVTGRAEQDDVVAALVYGANGYMTKPVKPEALLESVRTLLGLGQA